MLSGVLIHVNVLLKKSVQHLYEKQTVSEQTRQEDIKEAVHFSIDQSTEGRETRGVYGR